MLKNIIIKDKTEEIFIMNNYKIDIDANIDKKYNLMNVLYFAIGGDVDIHASPQSRDDEVIEVEFSFFNNKLFIIRSVNDRENIYKCNENFDEKSVLNISGYRKILEKEYRLSDVGVSFDEIIKSFCFLKNVKNFPVVFSQVGFNNNKRSDKIIKLLRMYEPIGKKEKRKKEANNKLKIFDNACTCGYINISRDMNRVVRNNNKIIKLQRMIMEIENKIQRSIIDDGICIFENERRLETEISTLERRRISLAFQMQAIENNKNESKSLLKEFGVLQEFFPGVNINLLESVQKFHEKMNDVLQNELCEEKEKLATDLNAIENKIKRKKMALPICADTKKDLRKILRASLVINRLNEKNKNFLTRNELQDDFEVAKIELKQVRNKQMINCIDEIVKRMNYIIKTLWTNSEIPQIKFLYDNPSNWRDWLPKNYEYNIIYVIVFYISLIEMSEIPFLIINKKVVNLLTDADKIKFLHYCQNKSRKIYVIE